MPQWEPPRSPGKLNVGCTVQPGNSQYFFFEKSFMPVVATAADAILSLMNRAVIGEPVASTGDAVADDAVDSPATSK